MKLGGFWFHFINFQIRAKESVFMKKTKRKYLQKWAYVVLLLIGILNFANALVTGMIVRKKELAIYESLGMSGRQIRRLFLLEGMLHGGVQIFILVPVVSVVTWFAGRWWVVHSSVSWCATWKFSLLPMWIVLPVLAGIAATVPLCCLHVIMEESVTQRLRCEQ